MTPPPPRSTLFPYTTLFRSGALEHPGHLLPRVPRSQPRGKGQGQPVCRHAGFDRERLSGCFQKHVQSESATGRSEEHTSELQSQFHLVCRLLLEKKKKNETIATSQESVHNQNEPQLRDENAHNDKSFHGVFHPPFQPGFRLAANQPDMVPEHLMR